MGRYKHSKFITSPFNYGRGGAVNIVADGKLSKIAESIRDWGRGAGAQVEWTIHVTKDLIGNW